MTERGLYMKFRRLLSLILATSLMVCCLIGCGTNEQPGGLVDGSIETANMDLANDGVDENTLSIVATIFPEYDWVREIMGDKFATADVTMLVDNGVDMHSFQPSAKDILKMGTCDLFIYVGGESDAWVNDTLKGAVNKNMKVVSLLDVLGDFAKEEEIVEGMEEADKEVNGEDELEYDEHVWLSLKNTQILCAAIAEAIEELDPDNADVYRANVKAYNERLVALDNEYKSVVDNADNKTLLFGDRFPFRYLVDDYGLSYYAAFAGCSAETEASFETITFLSSKVDELGLFTICTLEETDHKIAETIKNRTRI